VTEPAAAASKGEQDRQRHRAGLGGFLDGVDEAGQGDHGLAGGDQVPGAVAVARAAGHESGRRGQGEQHDGDVEEEDRAPPEALEQQAADDRAQCGAECRHGAPDANGDAALVFVVEGDAD